MMVKRLLSMHEAPGLSPAKREGNDRKLSKTMQIMNMQVNEVTNINLISKILTQK